MAERLAIAYAKSTRIADFTASSVGTRAAIGQPIHPHAASVLQVLGGDSSNFSARQISAKIILGADLVIAMTEAHRDAVLVAAPQKLNRTFTLSEAAKLVSTYGAQTVEELALLRPHLDPSDRSDIMDPIGRDTEVFRAVGEVIAELVPPIVDLFRRSSV